MKKQDKMDKKHESKGMKDAMEKHHGKMLHHLEKALHHHEKAIHAHAKHEPKKVAKKHEAAAGHKYNESPKHKKAEAKGEAKHLRKEKHTKF
jgi:hypothetical protein